MARTLLFLFRWGVFAWACVYLWRAWGAAESSAVPPWIAGAQALDAHDRRWIALVVALMLLNWGLEARKWRLLLMDVERLTGTRSFAATLAGCGVSLITPNRTGEFLGRVLFVRPGSRIAAASLTVLGNISQVLVTLVMGSLAFALLLLLDRPLPLAGGWLLGALITASLIFSLIAAVLFLRPGLLRQVLDVIPILRRHHDRFRVLGEVPPSRLLAALVLSVLRYGVFAVQFLILLGVFGSAAGTADAVLAVPAIFLLTTLVPTVMLTELGVRMSAAHLILQPLGDAGPTAVLATSALWTINVLLPAVIGSVILLVARIRTQPDRA